MEFRMARRDTGSRTGKQHSGEWHRSPMRLGAVCALALVVSACQTPMNPVAKKAPPDAQAEPVQAETAVNTPEPAPNPFVAALTAPLLGVLPNSKPEEVEPGGGRRHVGQPYVVAGKQFEPRHEPEYNRVGKASYYGRAFHGRQTANGETFDMNALSAAHPTLPLPSYVRVTNIANGRSLIVRVNDRGPFAHGRIIDVSREAARKLDFIRFGTTTVRVAYVGEAPLHGRDRDYLLASYRGPADGKQQSVMVAASQPAANGRSPAPRPQAVATSEAVVEREETRAPLFSRFNPLASFAGEPYGAGAPIPDSTAFRAPDA